MFISSRSVYKHGHHKQFLFLNSKNSSSLNPLGQMNQNLIGSTHMQYGRSQNSQYFIIKLSFYQKTYINILFSTMQVSLYFTSINPSKIKQFTKFTICTKKTRISPWKKNITISLTFTLISGILEIEILKTFVENLWKNEVARIMTSKNLVFNGKKQDFTS
jgi:hypothetical protein